MLVTLQVNPDGGILASGVSEQALSMRLFLKKRRASLPFPARSKSENALKHRFPENPNP
jgi:hypothetical protein